ncbi:MAG: tRNA (N(6)-L-threonylcarbamoyladenosine(37)-C(2))-methylthiotransferase MtaB [Acetobacteraceae bacterium]|nr:tRNA (N(6)-L-threonylcarbamoyladenosine(37)-C(2))-methylthiotransferase MtaB [Acetobacteraceae bacterium]
MTLEVLTFGCRLNAFESEVIRGHAAGLENTVVINTCAVTAEAERQCRKAVLRAHRERPTAQIVVTGCAAQIAPARWAGLPGVGRVLGNREKLEAASWLTGAPSAVGDIGAQRTHSAPAIAGMAGRARAFIDVQQGCDHACTFCIIPQGRGVSRSVTVADAVRQVRALVAAGINEVVLTGVDLASYTDAGNALGVLVRTILRDVPDLPRLRLSSLDPAAIDEALWRALAEEERLMPHLHLSLQSGSDMILKRMRRRHSRADALAAIDRARRLRPGIAIGADLIAGFPTETEAHQRETLDAVDGAAIPYVHVFPFSDRPGTPAARMPPVPVPVRRARAEELRQQGRVAASAFHARQIGRTLRVVVERGGVGHSEHFTKVKLRRPAPVGALVSVMATAASADGVEAD